MFTPASIRSASYYKMAGVEASVASADAHGLISLLLEELLRSLRGARAAMERKDIPTKCRLIDKALRILEDGLILSLNVKEGGELAQNLNALYEYSVLRLVHANAHNDLAAMDEVCTLMLPILDAWSQIGGTQSDPRRMAA